MRFKRTKSGFQLPEIGLGTWTMGGEKEQEHSRDAEWISSIKLAIEMGYTHIDTAAMYGAGHSEELVGKAIQELPRNSLIIATKVRSAELAYDRFLASARASIGRLGVASVDLLYIHGPNPNVPLSETMRAMDLLVAEGLTKQIAVSNFTLELLKEAQSHTANKIVANQVEYSLGTREKSHFGNCVRMESELLPYCQQNDILLVAYMPLSRGVILKPNALIDEMVRKYEKTPAQIAIQWLIAQDNVVTIAKSDNAAHLKENLGGSGWNMDPHDVEKLRAAYPSDSA